MRRLLCIWLPDWPIQRLRADASADPTPAADTPVESVPAGRPDAADVLRVLWQSDPRRGRIVVAYCPLAAQTGVRHHMSVAQATEQIAGGLAAGVKTAHPVEVVIARHDRDADTRAIGRLAEHLQQQLCPLIGLEPLDRFTWAGRTLHLPQTIVCDLTGVAHLFGGEAGMMAAAERVLQRCSLVGQLGIADTLGAAWALANYGHRLDPGCVYRVRPRGWIAPMGLAAQAIDPLPVEALRLSPETVHTLGRLGIETVGHLLKFPRSSLASRLGDALPLRIMQATGLTDESVPMHHAAVQDQQSLALEYPTDDWPILHDRIGRLLGAIKAGLAARNRGALRLTCRLDLSAHPPLTLEIGLFAPTLDVDHWRQLIQNSIETKRLPSTVTRITIAVPLSDPLRMMQRTLLNDRNDLPTANAASGGSALARLVDSLSGRLGRHCVRGVRVGDDPLPEQAFESFPLAGRSAQRAADRSHAASRSAARASRSAAADDPPPAMPGRFPARGDALRRPLELIDPPVPLVVITPPAEPGGLRSLPAAFGHRGGVYRVVRSWGPERIETRWWQGDCIRRDYFRIETDHGHWWWVYRDLAAAVPAAVEEVLEDHQRPKLDWMLHGRFA